MLDPTIPKKRRTCHINDSIVRNFANRVKNYVNDNPDKKLRKIQRIWYNRSECDAIEIHSSFGNNLTGIILDFPRLWDNKCRCQDLDTFFKVFHANLNWLEIHIDMHNIGNNNILSQLFKNNKQLCDDLSKTEAELPFDQLLKKFNCENKCLPQIKNLVIDFEKCVDNDESCLSKLLNNLKLVQLLNIQESVECLWFTLMSGAAEVIKHKSDIENLNQLGLSKLDNLEKCRYILHLKSSINETEMENFLQFANAILLQVILMKPRAKYVCMIIKTKGWILNKNLTHNQNSE